MAFAKPATLALCLWTTTCVMSTAAAAQSLPSGERTVGQTCTDGGALWSGTVPSEVAASLLGPVSAPSSVDAPMMVPVQPAQAAHDIQWCVDSEDPRCMPDPAGAPAAHLAHAGDAAHAARVLNVAAAPLAVVSWRDQATSCVAHGVVLAIERPPQSR
jgi:hypothetical protein